MNLQNNIISMKMSLGNNTTKRKSSLTEKVATYNGAVDYEKNVVNKPTLNGKEIVGDMTEDDPSMVAIELSELNKLFKSVFG